MRRWESAPACGTSTYLLDSIERNKSNELGLSYGAIDFVLTPDNNYIFLEINPNGQWAWIENETGLNISDSIINELLC